MQSLLSDVLTVLPDLTDCQQAKIIREVALTSGSWEVMGKQVILHMLLIYEAET